MSAIIQTLAGFNMVFGDPERGLHHMGNGFEMQPDNPLTGFYVGTALGEFLGRFEEAIPPLEHSASLGWLSSLALLASYHARLGNLERAAHFEAQIDEISKTRYVTPSFVHWSRPGTSGPMKRSTLWRHAWQRVTGSGF